MGGVDLGGGLIRRGKQPVATRVGSGDQLSRLSTTIDRSRLPRRSPVPEQRIGVAR
jgi:hypothetical protein